MKLRSAPPINVDVTAINRWWEIQYRRDDTIPVIEGFSIVKLVELARALNLNWVCCYALMVDKTNYFRQPNCRNLCNFFDVRDPSTGLLRDFRGPTPGLIGALEAMSTLPDEVNAVPASIYKSICDFAKGDNPNPAPLPPTVPTPKPDPIPTPAPVPPNTVPKPSTPSEPAAWLGVVERFLNAMSSVLTLAGMAAVVFPAIRPFVALGKTIVAALLGIIAATKPKKAAAVVWAIPEVRTIPTRAVMVSDVLSQGLAEMRHGFRAAALAMQGAAS